MTRLYDLTRVQRSQSPVVAEKYKFPGCKQLDQRSMTALDLFRAADEDTYFTGVLGANRNDGVPFAVIHTADDDPFHPV
ncbi:hypothetical protein D3C80_1756410 [compost metagenome]